MTKNKIYKLIGIGLLAPGLMAAKASGQTADALINKLLDKGILTEKEAKDLKVESSAMNTNLVSASKWKIADSIKSIQLYGDLRLRYEYRAAENAVGSGIAGDTYMRERFRYAARLGIKGDLFDNFNYGFRLDTSTNPRSAWVTFGDDSNPAPFAKNSDGIGVGQIFIGWKPLPWYEMTVGKMPNPIYTTTMVWDSDFSPEGAVEKFKVPTKYVDLFANFGQFLYQDSNPDSAIPSTDTFMLAFQVGAEVKINKDINLKVAPVVYAYTGVGSGNGLNRTFTGEGFQGLNNNPAAAYNNSGINDLTIIEIPGEINYKLGKYTARLFGDFAYNFDGDERARNAATVGLLPKAYTGENKAYMAGISFGNSAPGLTGGSVSKKNTWETRAYWQHVEQYALDVNLLDSDFFEGRANLQGVYAALAYSLTDSIVGTFRYGYANRINHNLGTGGTNPDLPILNPINNYHIIQFDLSYRF